jgi:triacylglycerol esterase/lipase EstA (alpha/beta hydrolase family)
MSLPVLSNHQIVEMCSIIPSFQGCPLNKELDWIVLKPSFAKSDLAWIILYLPLEGPQNTVGHWVLLWSPKRGTPVFFDSFGAPPSKAMLKLLKRLHRFARFDWQQSSLRVEQYCAPRHRCKFVGYWCMSMLYSLTTGSNLQDFLSNFSDDFDFNESILHDVFRSVNLSH